GTIRGQKLGIVGEIEVTAQAGYDGIEPWMRDLHKYVEEGNSLKDLRKRIDDSGLAVEGAIGFLAWAVDDEARRAKAMEDFKRDMNLLAQLGANRIAAPPAGINRTPGVDLNRIAERYRTVLELGREMGVLPQLEIWGTAQTLGHVSEAAYVAIQTQHPDACLLLDAYHLFRGGSGFGGLTLLSGAAMHVFHINDYPSDPPREEMNDSHRIYPGDGIAPMDDLLGTLYKTGFRGALSLEVFNRSYWEQDALTVARTGIAKIDAAVKKALS
ncbi:MAG: sugar phosphate isomerase/epimerase family protein, partial [Pirellulaceae bacterium]